MNFQIISGERPKCVLPVTTQLPLIEMGYVVQFINRLAEKKVMHTFCKIAGGCTIHRLPDCCYLIVAVERGGHEQMIRDTVRTLSGMTVSGFVPMVRQNLSLGCILPKFRNPGVQAQRQPLFSPTTRAELVDKLRRRFGGSLESVAASGLWRGRGGIIEDPSDMLLFPSAVEEDVHDFIETMKAEILDHPDSDQQSIYVFFRGCSRVIQSDAVFAIEVAA